MRLEVHAVVVNVGEAFLALAHVVVTEGRPSAPLASATVPMSITF